MLVYQIPTNQELNILIQEYVIQDLELVGETILPFQEYDTDFVLWDQLDNEFGITAAHNMNSDPVIRKRPGSTTRQYTPIPFKESELIKEEEILRARRLGTLGNAINLDFEVTRRLRARMGKDRLRAEWTRWQALGGQLNIAENGVAIQETFAVQTYNPATLWSNTAAATPLKDFDAISLLFDGTGATAEGATAFMNKKTANLLLENTNDQDIHGLRGPQFISLTYSVEEANKILTARGLPNIRVYNAGYYDANRNFQHFMPDGLVVIVGRRPVGERVGEVALTRTLHKLGQDGQPAPGFFAFIEVNGRGNPDGNVDLAQLGTNGNPKIAITSGFYGGPLLFYVRSIVKAQVS